MNQNIEELKLLINRHDPTIITLQEVMTVPTLLSSLLNRYNWYTNIHPTIPHHSVAVGILKHIPSNRISISTNLPAVAVQISSPEQCSILCLYLSHSINPFTIISDRTSTFQQINNNLIVLGDFNAQHITWGCSTSYNRGNSIANVFETIGLEVISNQSATRISPINGKGSILDYCAVSSSMAQQFTVTVSNDTHGSDHFPLLIHSNLNLQRPLLRPRWKYEEPNWAAYQREIMFNLPLDENPPLSRFTACVEYAASRSIPRTTGKPGKRCEPWWNATVATAIKARRAALRKFRRASKNPGNFFTPIFAEEYRTANRLAKEAVRLAKKNNWDNFINEINPQLSSKEVWRRVGCLNGKNQQSSTIVLKTQDTIIAPAEVPEAFAIHFSDVSAKHNYPSNFQTHKLNAESVPISFPDATEHRYNSLFTITELHWALRKCKGRSAGPDNIGYPLLQNLPVEYK
ncbi:uncharacterized protein LOC133392113 isoform X1 [Anopheles gambiae]|uniref:uncharacterized protein LOC133392113 isoform X1 n=1 Tax=Anopheles gambiae TaxID=7165 RepID=UPI002AC990AA|nr:uncharacterized protein LOC133392113 isoform X1 [Anopheles gambiae]